MKTTQKQLEAWLRKWQPRLKLSEWDIKVKLSRREEMDDAAGSVTITPNTRLAVIRVMDPVDWMSREWSQDIEQTIVHELVHVVFWGLDENRPEGLGLVVFEQGVDGLASSLVEMDRRQTGASAREFYKSVSNFRGV